MTSLSWWVNERESIRLKRAKGLPAPWTQDEILSRYRFCNVRRKHDRVSQWILNNVMTLPIPEGGLSLAQYGMFLALCRWVNWPPTIQAILDARLWPSQKPDWRAMGELIDARAKTQQAWTGAYMVRGEQKSHRHPWAYWGKGRYVAEIVVKRELLDKAHELRAALKTPSRSAVASVLQGCYGWGPFMAGQVVDDWAWTPLLSGANDHYSWAPQGPGSVRGANRLLNRPLTSKFTDAEWQHLIHGWRDDIISELGSDYEDLTLHDCQNILCEYDKYQRARLGEGRPRSIYKPETAY